MAVDATVRNDALVNEGLIRQWLLWGLFWLMPFPTVGVIASTKFVFPDFLGRIPWLTFGRIRPIHVNGVIWGAYSTFFIGLSLYIAPGLAGVRLWKEQWDFPLLWVWNLNLALAVVLLALGWNRGWEAGEFAEVNNVVIFLSLLVLKVQFLMTIKNRKEAPLYVSLWYLIASFIWTDVNLIVGMVGPYSFPGVNHVALHGLFIHYLPAKFLMTGSICYLFGCFQATTEALRSQ